MIQLQLPIIDADTLLSLRAGDAVMLSGYFYTARDAAHGRLIQLIQDHQPLPIELQNQGIYYAGPCPAPPTRPIGSCGPTTSGRVDGLTPSLLDRGLKIMVGKGPRNQSVIDAMVRNGAVYFAATGGAAALIANCVTAAEVIAFDDLGTEAIRKVSIKNLPVITAIDSHGNNLFETGPASYLASHS